MVKICKFDGCNEEIADWQDLCPRHFAITQQQKQESNIRQENPQTTTQKSYVSQPTRQEPTIETVKNTAKQSFKIPELEERERLIFKQSSMKSAIEFLQQTPIEYQDYDDMISQLRRLTVDIYKIVVERNEGM